MLNFRARKVLRLLHEVSPEPSPVPSAVLVERSGLSGTAVTAALKQLSGAGLVEYSPYRGASLSRRGILAVREVVRRQRLLELFLTTALGFTWDSVQEEAERLEAGASPEFVERVAGWLGDPRQDPHGAPIPDSQGNWPDVSTQALIDTSAGETVVLRQVSREDADLLRYLADIDLYPGSPVHVLGHVPFHGGVRIRVGQQERLLAASVAGWLRVEKKAC